MNAVIVKRVFVSIQVRNNPCQGLETSTGMYYRSFAFSSRFPVLVPTASLRISFLSQNVQPGSVERCRSLARLRTIYDTL